MPYQRKSMYIRLKTIAIELQTRNVNEMSNVYRDYSYCLVKGPFY